MLNSLNEHFKVLEGISTNSGSWWVRQQKTSDLFARSSNKFIRLFGREINK